MKSLKKTALHVVFHPQSNPSAFYRRFLVVGYQPPWMDYDGNCIAQPDPNYKHRFALRGMHCTNDECAEWLMAIAGSEIVRVGEDAFEYTRCLPAMTIAEWQEWEVGKAPWEVMTHGSDVTLYFDDFLKARMKAAFRSFDESFNNRLSAVVDKARLEIDALCAKALRQIEQFS